VNPVLAAEWEDSRKRFEHNQSVRSAAGKRGNAKRWDRKSDEDSSQTDRNCDKDASQNIATGTGTGTGTGTKGISKASPSHPEALPAGDSGELFPEPKGKSLTVAEQEAAIYECYPRKEGRRGALEAISKAVKRVMGGELPRGPCDALMARRLVYGLTLAYARSPAGSNPDRTRIPHPATWFNQARYADDQENWKFVNGEGGLNFGKNGRIDAITDSNRGALELLERMDSAADCGGRGLEAGADPGPFFEGAGGAIVAGDAGGDWRRAF
jgi:hypothetical protein